MAKNNDLVLKELEDLRLKNTLLEKKISDLEKKHGQDKGIPIAKNLLEKYNSVIENAPWGIIVSFPGKKVLEANRAACEIFGYSQEEFKEKSRADILVLDQAFETFLNQRITEGRAKSEVTGIRKNGEKFPLEFSSIVFLDPDSGEWLNSSIAIDISERKKTERLIHETNQVARIGGWELDLVRNEFSWSDITKEIHEVSTDYKPDFETAINFYKEGWSRNLIDESVLKLMADGTAMDSEVILVTAKGGEIWVRYQGKAEFENGKCRRIYGTLQDINERKQLQFKEERQRANFKALLENINDRVYSTDMNLNLTSFNQNFKNAYPSLLEKSPDLGENLSSLYPAEFWKEMKAFLGPVLKGLHSTMEKATIIEGEQSFFEKSASPIFDDNQKQIGISLFSRDITLKKKKEALLLESREFYKSLFENNPDAAYSLSLDGNILTGNSNLIKLLEIEPEQLSNLHFSKFFPPEDLERIGCYFENLLKGIPNEFRSRILTANGNIKVVDNRTIPVMLNGEVISIFGIAKDISLALKKEKERKLILETILDYFYVLDNDFNFTYINEAAEKLLDQGLLIGKNLFETFPVLDKGVFFQNLVQARQTQKPVHFDYHAEELNIWFDENFYPHADGISVFFRSINDKKQAEQELQDQKIFFEQTFLQSAVSTILLDKDGYCLKINPMFSSIFGLLPEMVENKKYNVFDDPEIVRQEIDKKIRVIIDEKTTVSWETMVDLGTPEGSEPVPENPKSKFYLKVIGFPILDSEGTVSHVIIQHNDITESKMAEIQMSESEAKYRKFIENLGIGLGLLEVDNDHKIIKAYPQFCKMTGYSEQELLGQNAAEIFSNNEMPADIVETKIVERKRGISENYEVKVRTKDGQLLDFLINGSPVTNSKGEVIGSLGVHFDITDRLKAVKELKQQKELAESIISNIPIMVSIISKEGKFTSVNKIWEKELGWSEEEAKKSPEFLPSLIPNENVRNEFIDLITKGKGEWKDFDLTIRDRTIIHSSWTNIRLSDGRTIGIGQNITERKQFEESLKQSNERYQYVTKATFDAIWDSDLLTGNVYWGEGFTTLFGYSVEYLKEGEKKFKHFLHPDDADRIHDSFQYTINGSELNWSGEYRFRKADGNYAFVEDRAIIIRDPSGTALRAIGAMQDVTKQKEEEHRLKLLESAITNSSDGILILEVNESDPIRSKIVFANQAFSKMSGYGQEEIVGQTQHLFLTETPDESQMAIINKALTNYESIEIESIHYKKNGDEYWVSISMIPVADRNGKFTHWISIQEDTTLRKKRELEKEGLLRQLTKSNNELKQFSFITSHNLRSPLTNLMAISELIDTSLISDQTTVELIEGFRISTVKLNETLEDLIKILIIKEVTEVQIEKINFEDVFKDVTESIQSMIDNSSALIQTNFSSAKWVLFNKPYLHSIFLNLITNSIKYAKKGKKPVIFIYSIMSEDYIQLIFEDDGMGFNLERARNKVFGLYQKFHNNTDSKGIGLYLVHTQITSLGGSIEVESEENQGAKFTLTFKKNHD